MRVPNFCSDMDAWENTLMTMKPITDSRQMSHVFFNMVTRKI